MISYMYIDPGQGQTIFDDKISKLIFGILLLRSFLWSFIMILQTLKELETKNIFVHWQVPW